MVSAREVVGGILAVVLGLYCVAVLLPDAIMTITEANTTGWSDGLQGLWDIISMMALLAIVVIFVMIALDRL